MTQISTTELLNRELNDVEEKYAPPTLYYRGDLALARNGVRVSIVGSRGVSDEGRRRARRLAKTLAQAGMIVVSGLAKGVDRASHEAAIEVGGRTIAVIGTGLDVSYPRENAALQERIAREHLLVTQYTPGTPPLPGNFPRRNRVMALLSEATVIVEAGEKSGTISQGWEALRLGRSLFLLRSLVESGLSWPNEMLRYGATVLGEPEDALDELPSADFTPAAVAF